MMAHVFATGEFPAKVLENVDLHSKKEGLSVGRLTQFSKEEQNIIKSGYLNVNVLDKIMYEKNLI